MVWLGHLPLNLVYKYIASRQVNDAIIAALESQRLSTMPISEVFMLSDSYVSHDGRVYYSRKNNSFKPLIPAIAVYSIKQMSNDILSIKACYVIIQEITRDLLDLPINNQTKLLKRARVRYMSAIFKFEPSPELRGRINKCMYKYLKTIEKQLRYRTLDLSDLIRLELVNKHRIAPFLDE